MVQTENKWKGKERKGKENSTGKKTKVGNSPETLSETQWEGATYGLS